MSKQSLENLIQSAGSPVKLLRNSQTGPYVYPVVPPEFTNWRDEQRAWQETCVLYNQSYHQYLRQLRRWNLHINSMNTTQRGYLAENPLQ
jgi:hypothetical protein